VATAIYVLLAGRAGSNPTEISPDCELIERLSMMRFMMRSRRGGSIVAGVLGTVTSIIVLAAELDAGRMYATHQQMQAISDASTLAGLKYLPDKTAADAAIEIVKQSYNKTYGSGYTTAIQYTYNGQGQATGVQVTANQPVPMFTPVLMGNITSRRAQCESAATVYAPAAFQQGVVPLGLQYNDPNYIPPTPPNQSSSTQVTLKIDSNSKSGQAEAPGNFYALDFGGKDSGADQWSSYLKLGFTQHVKVGDTYDTKTGNMVGPTRQALTGDSDSRFNRQSGNPAYASDTWSHFNAGDPRVIVVPLVDWTNQGGGSKPITIKGFAAFWIDSVSGGQVTGRFIRYTLDKNGGPAWDGLTVDSSGAAGNLLGMNTGLWCGSMTR
jgi:Flp pilus assembly protein TadG